MVSSIIVVMVDGMSNMITAAACSEAFTVPETSHLLHHANESLQTNNEICEQAGQQEEVPSSYCLAATPHIDMGHAHSIIQVTFLTPEVHRRQELLAAKVHDITKGSCSQLQETQRDCTWIMLFSPSVWCSRTSILPSLIQPVMSFKNSGRLLLWNPTRKPRIVSCLTSTCTGTDSFHVLVALA